MIGGAIADHTVTVWRFSELRGATFREVAKAWAPVEGTPGTRLTIQTKREARSSAGPGTIVRGQYKGIGPVGLDVCEGDVLEVTAGPEAPLRLKVESARRPRHHHLELDLETWAGSLA